MRNASVYDVEGADALIILDLLRRILMLKVFGLLVAGLVAFSSFDVTAGEMKKDSMMKGDSMKKDAMMKADSMKKDAMMKGDAMKKDGMMKPDSMKKDGMMKKDKMHK